jgi:hypothetical protein
MVYHEPYTISFFYHISVPDTSLTTKSAISSFQQQSFLSNFQPVVSSVFMSSGTWLNCLFQGPFCGPFPQNFNSNALLGIIFFLFNDRKPQNLITYRILIQIMRLTSVYS